MALKIKAKEREMKVGKYAGTYRYVMLPELYSTLNQEKMIPDLRIQAQVAAAALALVEMTAVAAPAATPTRVTAAATTVADSTAETNAEGEVRSKM